MDYAVLPPEVNSGRMYAGPGSGSMLAAAQAWDGLAAELYASAQNYGSAISGLTGVWTGPASVSMSKAAAPYVAWLSQTAEHAEHAGIQAKAAASAHAAAHAMTVPPPAIAANRAQLAVLVATNFFGQNAPAIAATETQYAQMWAQDAAAMNQYLADSQAATRLTPFHPPRQNTDPDAAATQSSATADQRVTASPAQSLAQALREVPSKAEGVSAAVFGNETGRARAEMVLNVSKNFIGLAGLVGDVRRARVSEAVSAADVTTLSTPEAAAHASGSVAVVAATPPQATVSAAPGRAASLRSLSIPRAWTAAAPEMPAATAASSLRADAPHGTRGPFGHTPVLGGQPVMAISAHGGGEVQNHHDPEAAKRKARGRRTTMR